MEASKRRATGFCNGCGEIRELARVRRWEPEAEEILGEGPLWTGECVACGSTTRVALKDDDPAGREAERGLASGDGCSRAANATTKLVGCGS